MVVQITNKIDFKILFRATKEIWKFQKYESVILEKGYQMLTFNFSLPIPSQKSKQIVFVNKDI